jgi:hypothetical protein
MISLRAAMACDHHPLERILEIRCLHHIRQSPVVRTSRLAGLLVTDPRDHRKKQCGHGEQLRDHLPANLGQTESSTYSLTPLNLHHRESPRDDEYDGIPSPRSWIANRWILRKRRNAKKEDAASVNVDIESVRGKIQNQGSQTGSWTSSIN